MKIAILYAGRIKSFDVYYNNLLKYIIKDNDVDIFLYHNKILNENLEPFIELYKPKVVIDEYVEYTGPVMPPNMSDMSMFYSRKYIFDIFTPLDI